MRLFTRRAWVWIAAALTAAGILCGVALEPAHAVRAFSPWSIQP